MARIMTEGPADRLGPFRSGEADAARRPVGGERRPDDPLLRDRAPEAAVVGGATIVTHHEVIALGHANRSREVALLAAGAGLDELLGRRLAVPDHVAVADGDRVAGQSDHPLDEVDVGARLGRLRARAT